MDENTVAYLTYYLCMRWLSLRLDSGAVFIVVGTALLAVVMKGTIPTALAGLALAYAVQVTYYPLLPVCAMHVLMECFVTDDRPAAVHTAHGFRSWGQFYLSGAHTQLCPGKH